MHHALQIEDKSKGIISFDCQKSEFEEGTIFQFWERYTTNAAMGSYNSTKAAQAFMKEVSSSFHTRTSPTDVAHM